MNFVDVVDTVLVSVPGCPHDAAVDALRDAAIEFAMETHCHITGRTVVFADRTWGDPNMVEQIVDVLDARMGGKPLTVTFVNDEELENLGPGESAITFVDPNTLQLTPPPTSPVAVELLVAVAPGPQATAMHDDLWRQYSKAIVDGALSSLYEIPKRSWSDPQLAAYHGDKFEKAKAKAMALAHRNVSRPARRLRVKPA